MPLQVALVVGNPKPESRTRRIGHRFVDALVAVPLLTVGGLRHAMGPTFTLAPLLTELGAVVPGKGLYFDMADMDRMDEVVSAMATGCRETLARLGRLGGHIPGEPVASIR